MICTILAKHPYFCIFEKCRSWTETMQIIKWNHASHKLKPSNFIWFYTFIPTEKGMQIINWNWTKFITCMFFWGIFCFCFVGDLLLLFLLFLAVFLLGVCFVLFFCLVVLVYVLFFVLVFVELGFLCWLLFLCCWWGYNRPTRPTKKRNKWRNMSRTLVSVFHVWGHVPETLFSLFSFLFFFSLPSFLCWKTQKLSLMKCVFWKAKRRQKKEKRQKRRTTR